MFSLGGELQRNRSKWPLQAILFTWSEDGLPHAIPSQGLSSPGEAEAAARLARGAGAAYRLTGPHSWTAAPAPSQGGRTRSCSASVRSRGPCFLPAAPRCASCLCPGPGAGGGRGEDAAGAPSGRDPAPVLLPSLPGMQDLRVPARFRTRTHTHTHSCTDGTPTPSPAVGVTPLNDVLAQCPRG